MPDEPNQMPRPDQGGQSLAEKFNTFLDHQKLINEARLSELESMKKSDDALRKKIDLLEESGEAEREIAKRLDITTDKVRKLGSAWNLSIQKILTMPLPQLIKDFNKLAISLGKTAGPLASLQAAIQAFQAIDKTLASVNRNAAAFATQSGNNLLAAYPKLARRADFMSAKSRLTSMGMSDDDQAQLGGALSATMYRPASDKAGQQWSVAAAAIASKLRMSPEAAGQLTGESTRMGVRASSLSRITQRMTEDFSKLPTEEVTRTFLALWRTGRVLGDTQEKSIKTAKGFETMLSKFQLTPDGLAQQRNKQFTANTGDLLKFAALSGNTGSNTLNLAGAMRDKLSDPVAFFKEYGHMVEDLAKKIAGGDEAYNALTSSGKREAKLIGMRQVAPELVTDEIVRTLGFNVPKSEAIPDSAEDVEQAFRSTAETAIKLDTAINGTIRNLGVFSKSLWEAAGAAGARDIPKALEMNAALLAPLERMVQQIMTKGQN